MIEKLEALLADGQDSASLRFALANAYLKQEDAEIAVQHAQAAIELEPDYSAAWRLLGQAQAAAGKQRDAADTFEQGIKVANDKGDLQVAKEMRVFLRRLQKAASPSGPE